MALESLKIRNFRIIKDFQIEKLGKINLITGKNGTGKSSLLEAIRLYAYKARLHLLLELVNQRNEDLSPAYKKNTGESAKIPAKNQKDFIFAKYITDSISGLFNEKSLKENGEKVIEIGPVRDSQRTVRIEIVKYLPVFTKTTDLNGKEIYKQEFQTFTENQNPAKYFYGLKITYNEKSFILDINEKRIKNLENQEMTGFEEPVEFISSTDIPEDEMADIWNAISLTDKQDRVLEALKIMFPEISQIAFRNIEDDDYRRNVVMAKLNDGKIVPLRSMGDGIYRLLYIALAAVNSENGFLLIDEFENGLHYSVQKELWIFIFRLSRLMNIQIFASTHSTDCIHSFCAAQSELNDYEAKIIRIEKMKSGEISPFVFTEDEFNAIRELELEIR